jgi:hypothetical protein
VVAATETAQKNAACVSIQPFYWELGDKQGALASGSVKGAGSTTYTADTVMPIASATKWFYSTYWVERTANALSASDLQFFNFWSGYTHFTGCNSAPTVQACLDIVHKDGSTNGTIDPADVDKFAYGGGHMQKHAGLNGLGAMGNSELATELLSKLGTDIKLAFAEPQLAGGGTTSAAGYATMLRKIIGGQLKMKDALGTHPGCASPATCPGAAVGSPAPPGESWHYSVGHWVEDDPKVGDGAFSSAGAFGFYPWIDASKTLYGIVARKAAPGSGMDSAMCGRLVRKAWVTGKAQ